MVSSPPGELPGVQDVCSPDAVFHRVRAAARGRGVRTCVAHLEIWKLTRPRRGSGVGMRHADSRD